MFNSLSNFAIVLLDVGIPPLMRSVDGNYTGGNVIADEISIGLQCMKKKIENIFLEYFDNKIIIKEK